MFAFYVPEIGPRVALTPFSFAAADWGGGLLLRSSNWLGDAVMSLPAGWRLRQLLPSGSRLLVACPAKLAGFWAAVPWVDEVHAFSAQRLNGDALAGVRSAAPGIAVVFPNSFGSAWDVWRTGIPRRVGRRGRGRGALLTDPLPVWPRPRGAQAVHHARYYLELAAACGATAWDCTYPPLVPRLPAADAAALDRQLDGPGQLLVVAPGAAYGPAKEWPADRFCTVARWWTAKRGRVIAIGAAGGEAVAAAAIAECPHSVSLAGKTNLAQLLYVMQRAAVAVVNDSGAMHVAAALGTPGVAVFGSTDPVATGPLGARWLVLRQPLPCSPCLARTCARKDRPYECLNAVTADEVIAGVEFLLAH